MSAQITAEFAKSLRYSDFGNRFDEYEHKPCLKGIPVRLLYCVLPANSVGFGAGSHSLNGVRTALNMQINPQMCTIEEKTDSTTGKTTITESSITPINCSYRLLYLDPNKVRTVVLDESYTEYVKNPVTQPNQFNFLAEFPSDVGMSSYLGIELTPIQDVPAGYVYSNMTEISVPVTITTYATASGI